MLGVTLQLFLRFLLALLGLLGLDLGLFLAEHLLDDLDLLIDESSHDSVSELGGGQGSSVGSVDSSGHLVLSLVDSGGESAETSEGLELLEHGLGQRSDLGSVDGGDAAA